MDIISSPKSINSSSDGNNLITSLISPLHPGINPISNTLFTSPPSSHHNVHNSIHIPLVLSEVGPQGNDNNKDHSNETTPRTSNSHTSTNSPLSNTTNLFSPDNNNNNIENNNDNNNNHNDSNLIIHTISTTLPSSSSSFSSLQSPILPESQINGPPNDHIDGSEAQSIRAEVIQEAMAGGLTTPKSMFIFRSFQLALNIAEVVLIITFLSRDWHLYCDYNGIRVFLIIRGAIDGCLLLLHIMTFSSLRGTVNKICLTILRLCDYCLVLYALVGIAVSDECNPSTKWLTIALCITTLSTLIAPIILFISVCVCFPLFLRILVGWVELQNESTHATIQQIDKIEKLIFDQNTTAGWPTNHNTECPVCLSEFEIGEEINRLPCHHVGHYECHVSWLKIRRSCPQCRRDPFSETVH